MHIRWIVSKRVALAAGAAVALGVGTSSLWAQTRDRTPTPTLVQRTFTIGGPTLGVSVRDLTSAEATSAKLDGVSGAYVESVRDGSPADTVDLRAGDVIVSFDGERVRSARHLSRLVSETPANKEVAVEFARDGARQTVRVTPTDQAGLGMAREFRFAAPFDRDFDVAPELDDRFRALRDMLGAGRLGVSVLELTDQLAEHYGVSGGLLVTSVDSDRPAGEAGIKAGDIITQVSGDDVKTVSELRRRVARASGDLPLTITRDGRQQTVTVHFEERARVVPARQEI